MGFMDWINEEATSAIDATTAASSGSGGVLGGDHFQATMVFGRVG